MQNTASANPSAAAAHASGPRSHNLTKLARIDANSQDSPGQ
jgi:hypothetical protein